MPPIPLHVMPWSAGAILAAYLGFIAYAVFSPRKHRDPHDGMAVGCLMFASFPAIGLAILLAVGVVLHVDALVRWTFYLVAIPAACLLVLLAAQPIVLARKRRRERRWDVP